MNVLWIFGVMLAGLNAGLLVSGLLEGRYLQRVSLTTFLQVHQPRDLMFRRIMPPILLALMACCLALVFFPSGNGQRLLALAAFVLVLADVLLTVQRMVPLNLQLGSYDALSPAPQGQDVRQRWYALHLLRTALGVGAFTLLVLIRPT